MDAHQNRITRLLPHYSERAVAVATQVIMKYLALGPSCPKNATLLTPAGCQPPHCAGAIVLSHESAGASRSWCTILGKHLKKEPFNLYLLFVVAFR